MILLIYDSYQQLISINTQINNVLDIELKTEISDLWKCPICYYLHPKGTEICLMCQYSAKSTSVNLSQGLDIYQQVWFIHKHDEYMNGNDPLLIGNI